MKLVLRSQQVPHVLTITTIIIIIAVPIHVAPTLVKVPDTLRYPGYFTLSWILYSIPDNVCLIDDA